MAAMMLRKTLRLSGWDFFARKSRAAFISTLSLALIVGLAPIAHAQDDVVGDEIKLGMTCGVTGIIAPYMKSLMTGIQVAIDRINSKGGVHGRKLKHVTLDDAYDGQKALENVKKLVEEEKIFALVGGAGTAASKAFIPYLSARGIPFLCPLTGGLDFDKIYFNARVTYLTESDALVEFAVKEFKGKKIGVFYQDDSFGTAGRNGVAKVLAQHGQTIAAEGKYDRATGDVAPGVAELLKTKPDIIYLQALPMPALQFMKAIAEKGYKPVILATSIVNSLDLVRVFGKAANNIYVSQVLPLPTDTSYGLVREYQAEMKAAKKDFNDLSAMEGYTAIKLFAEVLHRTGKDVTRQKFLSTFESMENVNLGGLKMSFSPTKHFGLERPFIVKIAHGKMTTVKK